MDLILLAGGTGDRSGLPYPKPLFPIHGKPIIHILIDLFHPLVDQIIIPCGEEVAEVCTDCIIVTPGRTRQESVYNALQKVTTDRVIIHEAVRPFVTGDFIRRVMDTEGCSVVPATPMKPTVFYTADSCEGRYLIRDKVFEIQLPQVFDARVLKEAHERAHGKTPDNFTDDSSLLYYIGYPGPTLINGLDCNIKLTTPTDFAIAEALYDHCHGR